MINIYSKFGFLDDLVIDNYLSGRAHMSAVIVDRPSFPVNDINEYSTVMNKIIEAKLLDLDDCNHVIIANLLSEMVPEWCPHENKVHYRKLKYLSFLYNKILIKKNNFLISLVQQIKRDLLSLIHLCSVFPFVISRINFSQNSLDDIFRLIRRNEEFTYDKNNSDFTTLIAKAVNQYTDLIPYKVIPEFDYHLAITEESTFAFECVVNAVNFPVKDKIYSLINNVTEETFIDDITEATNSILEAMGLKKSAFKQIAQYLIKFVYCKSNYVFCPLFEYSTFFLSSKNKTIADFGVPKSFVGSDLDPETTSIVEYVNHYQSLRAASDCIFLTAFEPSPIDVLMRVNEVLKKIHEFITEVMKNEGDTSAFIPFDDTFIMFCVTLIAADLPNFDGLTRFVTVFLSDRLLTNELSFAQTTIKGAYEWQQSANK